LLAKLRPRKQAPVSLGKALVSAVALLLVVQPFLLPQQGGASSSYPIKHVIVIMEENHSFDNYFGTFPGVIGGYNSSTCIVQEGYPGCIRPYHLSGTELPPRTDLCHVWDCLHSDYARGTNGGFYKNAGKLAFGYYDSREIPYYWRLAKEYTLMDMYFCSELGPTLPNHMFLVAGQSGGLISNDVDLKTLNGSYTGNFKSIFPELTNRHVSWSYYGTAAPINWNPAAFIPSVANNYTLYSNVKYPWQVLDDIRSGKLPQVSWVMPQSDQQSEHPPYDIALGESWVREVVTAVQRSQYWSSSAIIITFDENGGWYDSVPPPQVDAYGYGFRVPTIVVSPWARHGFIDHTVSDHTSTLAFIEKLFGLPPVAHRDAVANNMMEAFDFSQHVVKRPVVPVGQPTFDGNVLTATYSNNSTAPAEGTLYALVLNSAGRVVEREAQQFTLQPGEAATFRFQLSVPAGRVYIIVYPVYSSSGSHFTGPGQVLTWGVQFHKFRQSIQ